MGILTDDPDWAPDLYEARVPAFAFLRRYGRAQFLGTPWQCWKAERGGIVVTLYPRHTPILLTIDAPDESTELFGRVVTLEYESSNAWRITVDVYQPGRWRRQLKTMAAPTSMARTLARARYLHWNLAAASASVGTYPASGTYRHS
jgi:hypothetical protein